MNTAAAAVCKPGTGFDPQTSVKQEPPYDKRASLIQASAGYIQQPACVSPA